MSSSLSAIFGTNLTTIPTAAPPPYNGGAAKWGPPSPTAVIIECSSRPQKKGTAHHMKTRPKKTQLWDIKRKPTQYDPLPSLPPDWSLISPASSNVVDLNASVVEENSGSPES